MEWISVKERLPDKNGEYLCCVRSSYYCCRSICSFALNLEQIDEYDFYGKKYCGWYDYNSEYGYFEMDGITHWMPLPEIPSNE